MMLAKYIDNKRIERYKGYVIIDDTTYANNEQKAKEVGYKTLSVDEQPAISENEYLDVEYEEKVRVIKQHWVVREIEEVSE